jgi:hypothetical protein
LRFSTASYKWVSIAYFGSNIVLLLSLTLYSMLYDSFQQVSTLCRGLDSGLQAGAKAAAYHHITTNGVSPTAIHPVSSLLQRRLLRLFCAEPDATSSTDTMLTAVSGSSSSSSSSGKQKSRGKGKRARALEASWAESDSSKLQFVPLRLLESWGTATSAITSAAGDGGSGSSSARKDSRGGCCAREAIGHLLACAWSLHASSTCGTDSSSAYDSSNGESSSDSTATTVNNAEAVRLARAVLHRPLTPASDASSSTSTPTLSSSVTSTSKALLTSPLPAASVPLRAALSLVRFVRTGLPMEEQLAAAGDAQLDVFSTGAVSISDEYSDSDSDAPALPQCDPRAVSGRHVAGVAAMVGEALLSCLLSDNCSTATATTATTADTATADTASSVPYSWGSGLSEQHALVLEAACDVLRAVAVAAKQLQQSSTAVQTAAGASPGALKAAAAGRQELYTAAHSLQADGLGLARGMSDGEAVPAVLTAAGALQFLTLHLQSGEPPAEQSLGRWLGVCQALSLLQQHFADCSASAATAHSSSTSAAVSVQTAATVLLQLYKASLLPVPDDDSAENDRYTSVTTSVVGASFTMSQELSAQLSGQRQQQQRGITLSSSSVRAAATAEAQNAETLHLSARVALLLTLKAVLPLALQSTAAAVAPAAAILAGAADKTDSLRVSLLSALDCSTAAATVSSAGASAAVLCERLTKDLVDGLEDGLPPKEVAAHLDVIEVSSCYKLYQCAFEEA